MTKSSPTRLLGRRSGKSAAMAYAYGGKAGGMMTDWRSALPYGYASSSLPPPRQFDGEPYFCRTCQRRLARTIGAASFCQCKGTNKKPERKHEAMARHANWLLKNEFAPKPDAWSTLADYGQAESRILKRWHDAIEKEMFAAATGKKP